MEFHTLVTISLPIRYLTPERGDRNYPLRDVGQLIKNTLGQALDEDPIGVNVVFIPIYIRLYEDVAPIFTIVITTTRFEHIPYRVKQEMVTKLSKTLDLEPHKVMIQVVLAE